MITFCASDTVASFLDLNCLFILIQFIQKIIINGMILILILLIFYRDVPWRPCNVVYISQLIRLATASSHVSDLNSSNKPSIANFKQGYRYHKLCKPFSKFNRRHFELIEKYNVNLKELLLQGISNPEFYGDLVC